MLFNANIPSAIPIGLLLRFFGAGELIHAVGAQWTSASELVVDLRDRRVSLTALNRDELTDWLGADRIGDAQRGWVASDGRVCLEMTNGSTEQWVIDAGAVDRVALQLATPPVDALELMPELTAQVKETIHE